MGKRREKKEVNMDHKRYVKMKAVKWIGAYFLATIVLVAGLLIFLNLGKLDLYSSLGIYGFTIIVWFAAAIIIEMIYRKNKVYVEYLMERKRRRQK